MFPSDAEVACGIPKPPSTGSLMPDVGYGNLTARHELGTVAI
jgi:hypothetical protein